MHACIHTYIHTYIHSITVLNDTYYGTTLHVHTGWKITDEHYKWAQVHPNVLPVLKNLPGLCDQEFIPPALKINYYSPLYSYRLLVFIPNTTIVNP